MSEPGFWDKPEDAKRTVGQLKTAKKTVEDFIVRAKTQTNLSELLDMAETESDESMLKELEKEIGQLERQISDLETRSLLSGEHDRLAAIVNIHPGAGGTESQDWADMLLRMYLRWAERQGFKTEMYDYQPGEEAGKRSVAAFRLVEGRNSHQAMHSDFTA